MRNGGEDVDCCVIVLSPITSVTVITTTPTGSAVRTIGLAQAVETTQASRIAVLAVPFRLTLSLDTSIHISA